MPLAQNDFGLMGMIVVFLAFWMIALIVSLAKWLSFFQEELRYLNDEINRTKGEEQKYWIRQKRRLWLSIIPFVRY